MGITTRSDSPSAASQSTPAKKPAKPSKAKVAPEKAPVKADKVELKKEATPTGGATKMAAGLAENFAAKPAAVDPGQAAVDDARQFLGQKSQDLVGQLDNFQAAGGNTNNCADFVSSHLMNQGLLDEKHVNVKKMREKLESDGWSKVQAENARPGDVAFYNNFSHVELVSEPGGTMSIGSNNQHPVTREPLQGQQYVTERPMDPEKVTYWQRPAEIK